MILSWYWDGDSSSWEEDTAYLHDAMKVIRRFLRGKETSEFGSGMWFAAYDALASYPEPDDDIELLRELVRQEYEAAVRRDKLE